MFNHKNKIIENKLNKINYLYLIKESINDIYIKFKRSIKKIEIIYNNQNLN